MSIELPNDFFCKLAKYFFARNDHLMKYFFFGLVLGIIHREFINTHTSTIRRVRAVSCDSSCFFN